MTGLTVKSRIIATFILFAPSARAEIVEHPTGCPARAYCGCGVSIKVFGHPVRELFLASNWFRFPQAALAAGMVAVRRHHVFYIEQVLPNGNVLAYDPNSGGRQTRVHERSPRGFSIRNPNGARFAQN